MRAPPLGFRFSSRWGHATLHWVVETHAGTATVAVGGAPYMGPRSAALSGGTHADTATGAFGGAPYGATKYCVGGTHADTATGVVGGAPLGVTKRCA
eukprot:4914759-Pyramimonas_sp.AAC.1